MYKIKKTLRKTHKELTASPLIPSVVVFVTFMVLVGSSWQAAILDVSSTRKRLIDERAVLNETNILQHVHSYENALLAARGLILSSRDVNRDEWKSFTSSLNLSARRPGMLGLAFTELIKPSELKGYEGRLRAEGFLDFKVWPNDEKRDIYSSITFIEPFSEVNRPALGYDMYSDPVRREAMDRAIISGKPEMTHKITLVQEFSERETGLNLYQALYKPGSPTGTPEQRRGAVTGFVYSPFISRQLFSSVFHKKDVQYSVKVYDGTQPDRGKLLYRQHEEGQDREYRWIRTDRVDVAGITWTFEFGVKDSILPGSISMRPRTVLVGGTLLALVVAIIVYLLLQRRMRSLSEKEEKRVQGAKDSMLSLASHQLRTPATGVKQYVGMVLEGFTGSISKEQEDLLKSAYDSNERQLRIINEFLYMAKAEADRIVVSPQRLDLVELVRAVIDDMQSEIKEAGHNLRFKPARPKVFCAADVHSTRMIVENLISNAVKYTPSGGKIVIDVNSNKSGCTISVTDSGVGISTSDFPKLFQQFTRIPNELTKQTSGSGIGLYLAKQLAERNRGYITVKSERGIGSTFSLHLTAKTVKNFTET